MIWVSLGALGIGLSLGLLGSGGSILTVPVLTYLAGQPEKVAIAGSLGIVGVMSLAGGIPYACRGLVDLRYLALFGVPGMAGAAAGASLSRFVAGPVQLAGFAALVLVAAVLMLRAPGDRTSRPRPVRSAPVIAMDGLLVGLVTGLVGVGGGFLIVPALVLLAGLPMRRAVGTSLFVIALKSLTGFAASLGVLAELGLALDWHLLGAFAAAGVLGSLAGNAAGTRMPQLALKRAFAVFLVAIGLAMAARQGVDLVAGPSAATSPAAASPADA